MNDATQHPSPSAAVTTSRRSGREQHDGGRRAGTRDADDDDYGSGSTRTARPRNGVPVSVVETVAGLTAGTAATLALHPLDLVKVRLQVDRRHASHVGAAIHVARDIWRNEGRGRRHALAGLYRGLTPNLLGNSVSWGLYFLWYLLFRTLIP
ncbi:hypothetical protein KEM52_003185 [Ascosphaera acerosa]|nr:hypothetical protein KEM52_003185 [Ascosphaera acerosa]